MLNFVVWDTRSISVESWSISFWIAVRSVSEFVPFADWTASSFMRCSIDCTSLRAPSAVCTADMPSDALVEARSSPLICFLIFSDIARPAASSAARLILYPEESFSVDFDCCDVVTLSMRLEFIACILCCTTIPLPP